MTTRDLGERSPNGLVIESPSQAKGASYVVRGGAGLELIDEPEPLLRKGKRDRSVPRVPRYRSLRELPSQCFLEQVTFRLGKRNPIECQIHFAPGGRRRLQTVRLTGRHVEPPARR